MTVKVVARGDAFSGSLEHPAERRSRFSILGNAAKIPSGGFLNGEKQIGIHQSRLAMTSQTRRQQKSRDFMPWCKGQRSHWLCSTASLRGSTTHKQDVGFDHIIDRYVMSALMFLTNSWMFLWRHNAEINYYTTNNMQAFRLLQLYLEQF